MPDLNVPGYRAHVETLGAGARRVLALHCGLARGAAWAALSKAMPECTFTVPDLPGHGHSEPWVGGDFTATTLAVAERAAPRGDYDLIGHSYGGVAALAHAIRHPDRIRTLTVFEPVFFAVAKADGRQEAFDNDAVFQPVVDQLKAGDPQAAAQYFVSQWGGATPWEQIPAPQRDYMAQRIHTVIASGGLLHEDEGGILAPGALDRLKTPILLMAGANSPPVVHGILDSLSARLPRARRALIEGAGHMAPITRAGLVAETIKTFWSA